MEKELTQALDVVNTLRDENVSARFNLEMDISKGDCYFTQGMYSDAIRNYQSVLDEIAGKSRVEVRAQLWYKIAWCYHSMGNPVAKDYLEKVVTGVPTTWLKPAQQALNAWFTR